MAKTSGQLVHYVKSKIGLPYVFGFNGQVVSELLIQQKSKMYPRIYSAAYIAKSRKYIGKTAYDCSGLIDSFIGWDRTANQYLAMAKEKGPISTIPNQPGVLVHFDGHIGVYLGNGQVIEARGINYGIVQTSLSKRPWKNWSKCPAIDYPSTIMKTVRKGDVGDAVKDLQARLNAFGYGLIIDGDFGPKTDMALRDFQKKHNLVVDGICGPLTWAALNG